MVLNMGNTPYVVIVNEKSDEGQKVLEALEENIEKMGACHLLFRMAEPSAERSQKEKKHTGTGKDHAPVTVLRTKTQQQRGDEAGFH